MCVRVNAHIDPTAEGKWIAKMPVGKPATRVTRIHDRFAWIALSKPKSVLPNGDSRTKQQDCQPQKKMM